MENLSENSTKHSNFACVCTLCRHSSANIPSIESNGLVRCNASIQAKGERHYRISGYLRWIVIESEDTFCENLLTSYRVRNASSKTENSRSFHLGVCRHIILGQSTTSAHTILVSKSIVEIARRTLGYQKFNVMIK